MQCQHSAVHLWLYTHIAVLRRPPQRTRNVRLHSGVDPRTTWSFGQTLPPFARLIWGWGLGTRLIIKRLVHHAVYSVSSFLCNPYIPFLIYEIFHLLVYIMSSRLVYNASVSVTLLRMRRHVRVPAVRSMGMNSCVWV